MFKNNNIPLLKNGDKVRVIVPSLAHNIISQDNLENAKLVLNNLGLKVSFSKNFYKCDQFNSNTIEDRVNDLEDAFLDKDVKLVLSLIGGLNANELLDKLDFNIIKNNPKFFCGFSDIDVLHNSIYTKTGLVSYCGPHFSTFSMHKGIEYTVEYFKKCFFENNPFEVKASETWSDDLWFLDQKNRVFIENSGPSVYNPGNVQAKIVGGNLETFALLFGTEYVPDLKDKIVFIESDQTLGFSDFGRLLQSLLQQKNANLIKGLMIGRFQKESKVSDEQLLYVLDKHTLLKSIPVVYNLNFGHTTPIFTYPIGGTCTITVDKKVNIKFI